MKYVLTWPVASGKARLATILTVAMSLPFAFVISGGAAASGQISATQTRSTTKPTIVLVHGGWADSSGWSGEISRLTQAGYPVIAPANALRGLTSDADYIRSVLQSITGPIVLVGHSYGGAPSSATPPVAYPTSRHSSSSRLSHLTPARPFRRWSQ
jgi:pimeloyl-ACP methyl ester carboxylesterase